MSTDIEDRIKANVSHEEYIKLSSIASVIDHLDPSQRRPDDFPMIPRVAMVAGHLAGRGITIQNPYIDFTCTSFCFTDTRDIAQRGATNSQRFGRACGMLKEIYTTQDRMPVLISTERIMRDALSNETILKEKAGTIADGTVISLKDLVSKEDWDRVVKQTDASMVVIVPKIGQVLVNRLLIAYYEMTEQGTKSFTRKDINTNAVTKQITDQDHRVSHQKILKKKYIQITDSLYSFTKEGLDFIKTINASNS
jgi:hypothetical protein